MLLKARISNRGTDMFYDPLYTVSGAKDHYKQAKIAVMHNAKISVCPIFPSMFTDLPHVPRQQIVLKTAMPIPRYDPDQKKNTTLMTKPPDVHGLDRHKYFAMPVTQKTIIPALSLQPDTSREIDSVQKAKSTKNQKIQTKYRESSAQTSPWQPDYKVIHGSDPEILKLDFLNWGSGLPVGVHEIKLIERARMKRQWERTLPPASDVKSLKKRRDVIDAMEREEWAFREQEIQDIQNLRMELLEKMLEELLANTKTRTEKKMEMYCQMKLQEKEEKLAKLVRESTREKRRLDFNHRGIIMKYHPINIVDEHADYKSELYAPMMRHGVHPKRWHQVIDDHLKKYTPTYKGVEKYSTLPNWLGQAPVLDDSSIKLPGTRLCIRETKWTTPVLKELHEELKSLRQVMKKKCNLRIRVPPRQDPLPTPEVDDVSDDSENSNLGLVLVQSIVRGRATQILIFEGRDNCRELIQELRTTHGVLHKQKIDVFKQKLDVKYDQREEVFCIANSSKIQEALSRLQGTLVGTLLDFLNKELRRLLDERKAHALGLMAERERQRREAAEAGRRQYELRRRLEHDEMFKQIVKIHQETVDLYLENIITEGMDFASNNEAKEYVLTLAEKMDAEMSEHKEMLKSNVLEQEELIADLMHHFVLPEVEKEIVRQRIKKRQEFELKNVHNELFGDMETLPRPPFRHTRKSKEKYVVTTVPSPNPVDSIFKCHHLDVEDESKSTPSSSSSDSRYIYREAEEVETPKSSSDEIEEDKEFVVVYHH